MAQNATARPTWCVPRGVLFDLDGVLVDSSPLHEAAFSRALQARGLALNEAARALVHEGAPRRRVLRAVVEPGPLLEALAIDKGKALQALLDERGVSPIAGALAFVRQVRARGLATAIASNSLYAAAFVQRLGVSTLFDAVVTPAEVARPKPAPDLYAHAAQSLGLSGAQCWAVEDSQSGAQAALAAGARVFVLGKPDAHPPDSDYTVIDSFAELAVAFESVFNPTDPTTAEAHRGR